MKQIGFLASVIAITAVAAPAFAGCPLTNPLCIISVNGPNETALRSADGGAMTVTGKSVHAVVLPSSVGLAQAVNCPVTNPLCIISFNGPNETALRSAEGGAMTVTGKTMRAVILPSGMRVVTR